MKVQNIKSKNWIGAGILAAIAASLCCITPVLAFVAGISGIATTFSWLEPLRPVFIGITVLVLGLAWLQQLKPKNEINCDCEKDEKRSFLQTKKFLSIVTVFAALLLSFPYYSNLFFPKSDANAVIIASQDMQQVDLKISGMTCTGCEAYINNAVSKVEGVVKVESDYKTGNATVKFDQSKTSIEKIVNAIDATGYKVNNYTLND